MSFLMPQIPRLEVHHLMRSLNMSKEPALAAPDGVTSNLVNPPNRNTLVMSVLIVCFVVATLLVLVRVWAKAVIMRTVRIEDFFAIAAFACFATFIYPAVAFWHNTGYFVHQWNVPLSKMSQFLYIILIGGNLYVVNIMCIKIAIILDWLRIFVPGSTRNTFFWTCWTVLICNTIYYIANIVALNLACIPYQSIWDITMTGKCLDEKSLDISSAVMNLVSDIISIALVQKVIWRLQMSLKKKLGVSIIFAVGILGCVAGAFRLGVTVEYQKNEDATYYVSSVILWMTAEMTCAFLVFCIPSAPKAFSKVGTPTRLARAFQSCKDRLNYRGKAARVNKASDAEDIHGHRLSSLSLDSYQQACQTQKTQHSMTYASFDAGMPFEPTEGLNGRQPQPADARIIMTTQTVTTCEKDDHNLVSAEEHGRQHSWTIESA